MKKFFRALSFLLIAITLLACPPAPNPNDPITDPEKISCTVTFNSQGGTAVVAQTIMSGEKASMPDQPRTTADDSAFGGWFKESACTNPWDFNTDIVTGDVTIFAKWIATDSNFAWTLINGDTEYSVAKGTASVTGTVIIPAYHAGKPVSTITNAGFFNCTGTTSIVLPYTLTAILMNGFRACTGLTSVTLPNAVTTLGDFAFFGCSNLASITLSSSLTAVGSGAFMNCVDLLSIALPSSATTFVENTFSGCTSLSSVTLPSGLTTIVPGMFNGCTLLSNVTIPSGVTTIGNTAFMDCTTMTSLTIPSNVTTIDYSAFAGCTNLVTLVVNPTVPPTVHATFLDSTTKLAEIKVPLAQIDTYKEALVWVGYVAIIVSQ